MIELHINGHNFETDAKVLAYVGSKIAKLDKYLPKNSKNCAGKVTLTDDVSGREDNRYVCEVTIEVAGPNLVAKEAALNMYAAIDIVAAKLKSQANRYKQKHTIRPNRTKAIIYRLLRREESV